SGTSCGFKSRYESFLQLTQQWRHLKELKRARRGNDGVRKVAETHAGELAVKCIACPAPGINLPTGWENAIVEERFLYTVFIAIDACFQLKCRTVGTWETDPPLCDGGSYFVESGPYCQYCNTVKDQKEICTCTRLAAMDFANTKYSEGYSATGVGMCSCGHHELVMPNGVGDLQKGERYANMDYITASALLHIHHLLFLLVSYDIVCQWSQKCFERLKSLPPSVRLTAVCRILAFVIPKLHILGHVIKCQEKYNLLYTLGAAMADMEGIERVWSGSGLLGTSTREMGPGSRQNTIEDYWHNWNWQKTVSLGTLLLRRLKSARKELKIQRTELRTWESNQPQDAPHWKKMVEDFERQNSDENPFSLPSSGITLQDVRLQLAKEEQTCTRANCNGQISAEDVDEDSEETTVTQYIFLLLELEDQQYVLR
ncbi:hypothetical protein GYMLUDRAFT_117283, partial [Collybiopsis luxurians FD-317 M1]